MHSKSSRLNDGIETAVQINGIFFGGVVWDTTYPIRPFQTSELRVSCTVTALI